MHPEPPARGRGRPRKQPALLERQIAVRLTDSEHRALEQLAANQFTTAAALARELIRAELAKRKAAP